MRRSGYVCFLAAAVLLSSHPDAAFVPPARPITHRQPRPASPPPPSRAVVAPTGVRPVSFAGVPAATLTPSPTVLDAPAPRSATTTALIVSPNPAGLAAPVTLTATVAVTPPASGTPTGLVRFRANGVVIGAASVAASGLATLTTSLVTPGIVNLTAGYAGDTGFAPSTSPAVPHETAAVAASTITAVVTSPSPSLAGAAVTVGAIVLPLGGGVPTGTVQFFDGATPIGSAALASIGGLQVALTTINPATAGLRTLTARYAGSAAFAGSVSPPAVHTVYAGAAPSATTTTLAAAPSSTLVGQPVTLTATVTRAAGGVAIGTVDFYAYGLPVGSQTLTAAGTSAQATLTVTSLPKGLAPLSAAYRGAGNAAASATAIPVFQCVDCAAANATPLAKAGPIQAVQPGTVVQLDGSASSDLEGAPLTYTWTNIRTAPFQAVTLSDPTAVRPTFTAGPGEAYYAFDLVVSDGTLSSPPDRVYVIGTAAYVNSRPVAQAGPEQFVVAGQGVTLDGSGSFDPDAQPVALTYFWRLRSAPSGSTAELSSTSSPTPRFYLDLEGRYEFELVVFDGATLSAPDRVVVATNHPPVARAGDDQERAAGTTAYLSGAGSTDADGQRLTYTWTLLSKPLGSSAALSSTTAVLPTLPIDLPGSYVVRLVVNDGVDASDPDTVTISTDDLPPVADPGPAQGRPGSTQTQGSLLPDGGPVVTTAVGRTVRLDGTGSSDPNFQIASALGYQWTLVSRPAGSAAVLSAPTSTRPTFVADVAGDYVARLVVTSGALSSAPRDIRITTGNSRPQASAGTALKVAAGSTVRLDGSDSTDVNGDALTYDWSFITTPAGSTAVLSGDTSPRPSFIADIPGVYVAQVIVSDGSLFDDATVLVTTTGNLAPVGRAGADQAVPPPSSVTLDGTASSDSDFDPLTYRWVLTRKPAGSGAVLSSATTAGPGFSVDVAGDYVAQLRVTDGSRLSTVDTVTVTTFNAAPVADAGDDRNAGVGGVVALDAAASSDANGDPLTYQWAMLYRPAGSAAVLSDPLAVQPTFVPDVAGTYVVQLIAADATLRSAPDTVTVTTVGAPVAVAIAPDTAYAGASVPLDGTASSDAQLLPLTYLWSFGSRPAGSAASIANPLAAMTAFTPDLVGTYVVCLVVSNGAVASAPDCETVLVGAAPALTLSPSVVNLSLNEQATMTVTLNQPAGASGVTVQLEPSGTAAVTLTPPSVTIAPGATSATFTVHAGPTEGTATIAASAAGFVGDLAHVNVSVSGITITLGAGLVVAKQQIRDLSVTLSEPAPAGGVLIALASSNPAVASVTPSVFVPEGADVPLGNPQVIGLTYGMTEISATAAGLAGDTEVVAVARAITLTPSPLNLVVGGNGTLLLQLSAPAPGGGIGFNVYAATAGIVSAPVAVTVPSNQLTAAIPLTGQVLGTTSVSVVPADAGDTSTASATVTVSPAQPINLQSTTVGKNLQAPISGSLGAAAPPGGRQVKIESGDSSKVLLANNDSTPGTSFIFVTVPAGSTQIPAFRVQGLADAGVVQLTASATGFPDAHSTVTLVPSGFILAAGNFTTGLFSPNTALPIHAVRLDASTGMPVETQQLRPGAVASLTVTSSNPAVGTVGSPVDFNGPASVAVSAFDPLAAGTTRITLGVPAGFAAPAAGTQITATVAAPLSFAPATLTVGRHLQAPASLSLGSPAPAGNLPVTITSADPAKVRLAKTPGAAGSESITLIVPAGSITTPVFYVQSLDQAGAVAVNAAAANYDPAALSVTLAPSGIVFVSSSFTTHPAAPDTTLTLRSVWLEPGTLEYVPSPTCDRCQAVRGGYPAFDVTVASSDNGTGSVPNAATFTAPASTASTAFDPHVAGSVTLTIAAPSGFSTPANGTQIAATITPATATLSAGSLLIGKNLQTSSGVSLGEPAPAGNLLITIQSSDATRVLLSTTAVSPAMDTITVQVPAGQSSSPAFFVHALQDSGTVAVSLTAPGYIDDSFDVTLRPSGFVFRTSSFTTSTLSGDTPLAIRAVWLDPGTFAYPADPLCTRCQPLRTGVTAEVAVSSAPTTVGTITTSPVTIAPASGAGATAFHPLSGGTATLTVIAPAGFATPSTFREITATVANPGLSIADVIAGKDLQAAASVTLGAPAEAGGVNVTIVSADPASVLLSANALTAGASSLTLHVAAGATQSPVFYVQALVDSGAAQLSATANGYDVATSTVSFRPSGFVFVTGDFITGALSPNTPLTLRSVWLDPVSLTWGADPLCVRCQPVRGGITPVAVTVVSSDTSVGTITGPATFSGGSATASTAFDPLANGLSTLTIQAPTGFSASSDANSIVATVQPSVQVAASVIGRDLQSVVSGGLTAPAPAGGLLVTLHSSDPAKLLLANSPTAAGQSSITVPVPAGSNAFSFYAQALTDLGTAQIRGSAPGHTDGQGLVAFEPSGFAIDTPGFTVSPAAPNVPVLIRSVRIDADFHNYLQNPSCTSCQPVRPGIDVTVPVTSSDDTVGSIVGTAAFTGGVGAVFVQFDPHTVGPTTIALGGAPVPFSTPSNLQSIDVLVEVPPPSVNLAAITVGRDLQAPSSGFLGAPAPAGNLTVTITSADPDKVLLSASPTTVGAGSIIVVVPAGSTTIPQFYVQALSDSGPVQLTASAPGYLTGTSSVTLWPAGFVILTGDFTTSPTAVPTAIQVRPVRIDPTFHNFTQDQPCTSCQNLRAGATVDVPVISGDVTVGTITLSPLSFAGNDGVKSSGFDGGAEGTVSISLPDVPGFTTPSNMQSIQATVTNSYVAFSGVTGAPTAFLGKNLQTPITAVLGQPAPAGNLEITIASADPAKVLLSNSASLPGGASVTVVVPAGSTTVPTIYAQSLDAVGTVGLNVTAAGFVGNPFTLNLTPSGFAFMIPANVGAATDDFSTTSSSTDTLLEVRPVRLEPGTLNLPPWTFSYCYNICQQLRPGITASVAVTSSTTAVGTITNSPLTFDHTAPNQFAVFDPASIGATTVTLVAPPGFSQPSNHASLVATVTAPPLTIATQTIGRNLQVASSVSLGAPAPPGNVELTITSADPSKVLLTINPAAAGTASITLPVAAGNTTSPQFYIQALADTGTVNIAASAPGYASVPAPVTLGPSGFILTQAYWCTACYGQNISTTSGAANFPLYLVASLLYPSTFDFLQVQSVRGGLDVDVTVTTTPTGVGTIVPTPATVTGGTNFASIAFDPAAPGTTVLEVVTPAGFTATNQRQITATVTAAAVTVSDVAIGKDLQASVSVSLGEPAPVGGIDITIASADPAKVRLTADASVEGTASLTVHVPEGQSSSSFYAQAFSASGSVLLTATAAGHGTGTGTITLAPAGFVLVQYYWCVGCYGQTIATTTGAANYPLNVVAGRLNSGTGGFEVSQNVRGGLTVNVTISSTATIGSNVIAMVPPTVTFVGGTAFNASVASISADPINAGTAILEVVTPPGFTASNDFRQITATVTGPAVYISGDSAIGKDLQATYNVYLQEPAPTGGVDITIQSADSAKVVLAAAAGSAGASSTTVHIPEGSSGGPAFYVQGLAASGTVALSATAPGFTAASTHVTLQPSGFLASGTPFWWCPSCLVQSLTTTVGSPDYLLNIVVARLQAATNAFDALQNLRGGLTVNVTVQSTDSSGTNVGTIVPSVVTFTGDGTLQASAVTTSFHAVNPGVAIIAPVTPAGFTTPSTLRQVTATVNAPAISINGVVVGKDLQAASSGSLTAPAPAAGLAVTIASADPSKVRVALSPTDIGGPSIVVHVDPGQSGIPTFYVQALDSVGSVELTAAATGFTTGTASAGLLPSGFVSLSPGNNFTTTTLSSPVSMTVYSAALTSTLTYYTTQPVRPGVTVQVAVTATDASGTSVGTILGSPVEFGANQGARTVAFDPNNQGSSVITIVPPAGFSTPGDYRVFTATVVAPAMFVGDALVGKDLQAALSGSLGDVSPTDLAVTITSTDPAKVLLAASPTAPGAASITVISPGPTNVIPAFYVHGLADNGTVTLNVTAPSFAATTTHITLTPSGFIILTPSGTLSTQGNSANTEFQVASVRLAPGSLTYQVGQPLRPGVTASVAITSTAPAVGAITVSPLAFAGNEGLKSTFFDPQPVAADSTTTVNLATPAGFATPSQYQHVDVSVQAAAIDGNATSNYAQWLTGAPSAPSVANFETFAPNAILNGSEYAASGLTIVQRDGSPMRIATAGDGSFLRPANLNSPTRGLTSSGVPAGFDDSKSENYDFVFAHWVTSAGLWIGNLNPGGPDTVVQFLDANGAVIQSYQASAADSNLVHGSGDQYDNRLFVGLNSTVPIARIRVVNPAGDLDGVVFDDVVFTRAATTIIDFEDQPDNFALTAFPASYRGIQWTNFVHYAPYPSAYYRQGGVNAVWTAVDGARFTFPEQVFTGADISRLAGTTGAIFYELYRQGALVWTSGPFAGPDTELTFYPSGYSGPVDEVRMRSLGNSMTTIGGTWLMDNVSFIQTTPAGPLVLTPDSSSHSVGASDTMTVSILQPFGADLEVTLTSSRPGVASVPISVVIPAGATSVPFTVTSGGAAGGALITATSLLASQDRAVVAFGSQLVEWVANTSGTWNNGANWSGGVEPGPGDVVHIDRPGTIVVTVNTATSPVQNLYSTEPLVINGTLNVQNGAAFDAGFTLNGVLTGGAAATTRGLTTWNAGTIGLGGGLDIEAGQTLAVSTGADHFLSSSSLRNRGLVAWSGGNILLNNGATALNDVDALWDVRANLFLASNSNGANTFTNAGVLRKSAGAGQFTVGGGAVAFTNAASGTIDIQLGTMATVSGVPLINSGRISVAAPATFQLSSVTLDGGSTFSGAGALLANGTTTVSGTVNVTLPVIETGNFTGPGRLTMLAPFTWNSGTFGAQGGLDVEAARTLTISTGADHHLTGSSLRNRGTVIWNGGNLYLNNGTAVLNDTGGLWDVQGNLFLASNSNGSNTFTNAGMLRRSAGAGAFTLGGGAVAFTNGASGTIDVQTGTLANNSSVPLVTSGQLSVAAGATLELHNITLQTGSTFSGSGTLVANGSTTVDGDVNVVLPMLQTGNFTGLGRLTMMAPFTWNSGTFGAAGGLDIESGRTLTIATGADHHLTSSSLRNRGTVLWQGGRLSLNNGTSILNDTNALWDVQSDVSLGSNSNGANTFTNAGVFRRSNGSGLLAIGGGAVAFTSGPTGTIDVQSGTLMNASGVALTVSGNVVVAAGATFQLNSVTLSPGAAFSGGGTLLANGTTTVTGDVSVALPVTMTSNFTGSGRLTALAPFRWEGGTFGAAGGLDIEAGQTLTIATGSDHHLTSSSIRNRGTVVWQAGNLYENNGAAILNDTGALWEVQGAVFLASNSNGATTFTNNGLLRKSSAATFTIGGGAVAFTNAASGTIDVQAGTVAKSSATDLNSSGHISVAAGATFQLNNVTMHAGSSYSGDGTLLANGTTTVNGDVSVGVPVIQSGTFTGNGRLTALASYTWQGGTFGTTGGLDIETGRTLAITTGTGHILTSSSLRNRGTVSWDAGSLLFNNSATIVNQNGGEWVMSDSLQMIGNGNGSNTFTNAGILRWTGAARVLSASFVAITHAPSGTLRLRIGGTNAAAYDRIASSSIMTFGGTLDIQLITGFVPGVSDAFTPLSYPSRVGTFSVVNGNGHAWTPCYAVSSFSLGDPANATFCGGS